MKMPITRKRYYFLSLFLPVAVPIVSGIIGIIPILGIPFLIIAGITGLGLLFGGAQYALFVVLIYFWLRDKPPEIIEKRSWLLPLMYAPFAALLFTAVMVFSRWLNAPVFDLEKALRLSAFLAQFMYGIVALAVSYAYVLLAHLLLHFLIQAKVVQED